MKQHITVDQLIQIDSKIMKPYFDEWEIALAFDDVCTHGTKHPSYKVLMSKLSYHITIGKMIEILKPCHLSIDNDWDTMDEEIVDWWIVYLNDEVVKKFESKELCDALWEVVKYILEEEVGI